VTTSVSTSDAARADRTTIVAFATLVVLIGTNLVAIRIGNRELAPLWHAGFRFLVAAILFWAIAAVRRASLPSRRAAAGAAVYGLLSFAAFFGFLYAGLVEASVGIATSTLALGPLITLGLAAAIGLERLRAVAVVGAAIAFAGIAVMYASALTGSVPVTSLILLLAAAVSFAMGGIEVKRTPAMDLVVQNGIATTVGAVVLVALAIVAGEDLAIPKQPETWLAFVYLVIPGTLLTFWILLFLLRQWPVSRVAYQFVLAPIVAILVAAVVLGEPIQPADIAGTALVIVGVWLGALRSTTAR
jgi:drug/metabolite transporter (DMT)-like permease